VRRNKDFGINDTAVSVNQPATNISSNIPVGDAQDDLKHNNSTLVATPESDLENLQMFWYDSVQISMAMRQLLNENHADCEVIDGNLSSRWFYHGNFKAEDTGHARIFFQGCFATVILVPADPANSNSNHWILGYPFV